MPAPPEGLPPLTDDYFAFFGLERKLNLDRDELQKRFYALGRQLHPDRFTRRPPEERQYSEDATAILNDGYRILKDPRQRAEYVLRREGFDVGEQRTKDVPPELLEEVFELNMALEEMRGGDESARPQLEEARQKFQAMQDGIDQAVEQLFVKYDASGSRDVLGEIRGLLNKRRYVRNLIRDVEKELAPAAI